MGSCYSCKGDGGRTYAYTTVDMATTASRKDPTAYDKDKILPTPPSAPGPATGSSRNFGFAMHPSKKRTPELVYKHENYIAANINRNSSSSLPAFPINSKRSSSNSSSSNNSLGVGNRASTLNPAKTSAQSSRFGFGFKAPGAPAPTGSLESVASVNNSSDDNSNTYGEGGRRSGSGLRHDVGKKAVIGQGRGGGGGLPGSRTGSPIPWNKSVNAKQSSPDLRNSLNRKKTGSGSSLDSKNGNRNAAKKTRAEDATVSRMSPATVVKTQVAGLPKLEQVIVYSPKNMSNGHGEVEPMQISAELDEIDSGLGNSSVSERTGREGDGDSETLADVEQILEEDARRTSPNKSSVTSRPKRLPVVFPKPKPSEPTRPGCIRPVRSSGIPSRVATATSNNCNIFAIGRDKVLAKDFKQFVAATQKTVAAKGGVDAQKKVTVTVVEDEDASYGDNDVTITDDSQVLKEEVNVDGVQSCSPSPSKSVGKMAEDSQESSLKDSGPFSPPSERECFLIDDEIADQPDLIACNRVDYDGRYATNLLDWSGSLSSDIEGGGKHATKMKEKSNRRRSCSGGTLSPCSSLDSDDLILDFENADEHTAEFTRDRICWKDDVPETAKRSANQGLESSQRICVARDPVSQSLAEVGVRRSVTSTPTSDAKDVDNVQLENLDAMCLELADIKLSLVKLEKVLHEDSKAEVLNPFELTSAKNGLFLNLANSELPDSSSIKTKLSVVNSAERISLAESEQEKADLKRQIILLQQQLKEKDKSIKLLQQQLKMFSLPHQTEKDVCNAASQTDRLRPLACSSRTASTDENVCVATVSTRHETLC